MAERGTGGCPAIGDFNDFTLVDIDGDSDLDAIAGTRWDYGVVVLLNDGTGQFTATDFGKNWLRKMEVVDLNGDGAMDFVLLAGEVSGGGHDLLAWIYDENAGSVPYRVVSIASGLTEVDVDEILTLDIDGDGDLDVLTQDDLPGTFSLWSNDGTGQFVSVEHGLPTVARQDTEFHDVDGDGDLDAIIVDDDIGTQVWINDGTGVFSDSGQILPVTEILEHADLDGDGDVDLLAREDWLGDSADVWLNDGSGVFTATGQNLTLSGFSRGDDPVNLGDIDGDGDLDAIASNNTDSSVSVLINDGTGTFTAGAELYDTVFGSTSLADLDADGDLDVLIEKADSQYDVIWFNDGSGNFERGIQSFGVSYLYRDGTVIADVDGDGLDDIVVLSSSDYGHGIITVFTNGGEFGPADDVFRIDDDGELLSTELGYPHDVHLDNGFGPDLPSSPDAWFDSVTAINGDQSLVGQVIALSSGALMLVEADGDIFFDPGGAYDYLPEGDIERLFFEYTNQDGLTATVAIIITGTDNDDVFEGTDDDDTVFAGVGDDQNIGHKGHDALSGETGDDVIYGKKGHDTLDGGAGNDTLRGDGGNDLFIFSEGHDLVRDFDALDDEERIDLTDGGAIKGYQDLKNNHMEQVCNDVVITDARGSTMTLVGVSLNDLDEQDFVF